jgi:hypothetical protein
VLISGTLPAFAATPTVNLGTIGTAATAANQPTAVTSGSTTSGQTGGLVYSAATFRSPGYSAALTAGDSYPDSIDELGQKRVANGMASINPSSGAVTTAGAYAAGAQVGQILTFVMTPSVGTVQNIAVESKTTSLTNWLTAYIFIASPSGTFADNAVPAIATTGSGIGYYICSVPLNNPSIGLGGGTVWSGNTNCGISQSSFFILLTTNSAMTLGSTSDIYVETTVKF